MILSKMDAKDNFIALLPYFYYVMLLIHWIVRGEQANKNTFYSRIFIL